MRKKIIAGNWKMNHGPKAAEDFLKEFSPLLSPHLEWVIFPPYVTIQKVKELLKERPVKVGGQNCHTEINGAFTGEVSVPMLAELGCEYVLIGHSERRQYFGETNESCATKISMATQYDLVPMYCVGESGEERKSNQTELVLKSQLEHGLKKWNPNSPLVLAYEPVWAIGTGVVATPTMAEEAHRFIRSTLAQIAGSQRAAEIQILYGGSVKPDNSMELASRPNIDGFLVGGASLTAKSFAQIGQIPL